MRVIVVGSGVVGLCVAQALVERGVETLVLDRRDLPGGPSLANAGLVTPSLSDPLPSPRSLRAALRGALDPRGPIALRPTGRGDIGWIAGFLAASRPTRVREGLAALQALAREAVPAFEALAEGGVELRLLQGGCLHLAADDREMRLLEGHFDDLRRAGHRPDFEALDAHEVAALEPSLGLGPGPGGFHASGDRRLDPQHLCGVLRESLQRRGARIERFEVGRLEPDDPTGTWRVEGPSGRREADAIVVAAGVSTRDLLRPLGAELPLLPARGVSLTFPTHEPLLGRAVYLHEPRITVTPLERRLRVSSFFGLGMDGPALPRRRIARMLAAVEARLPRLRPAGSPEVLAGERSVLPDGLPAVGRASRHPGLYAAAGHSTLGVTLSAVTAELLVAEMLAEAPEPRLAALDPRRFGPR